MKKIRKKVNTSERFDKMMSVLVDRIKNNLPISDNPMLDGMIIGLMFSTESYTKDIFLNREIGEILDGTLQKLEHVVTWVNRNEDKLCEIL